MKRLKFMMKLLIKNSSVKNTLILFILFEAVNFFVLFATHYFSPIVKLYRFDDNSWGILRAFGNFDGFHYHHIAKEGYGQFQEAFFPLYPLIIKITSFATNTYFINAIIISNVSFLILLYLLFLFFADLIGKEKTLWFIFLLTIFPTSFFFGMVYTESLFLMFFISYLYSFKHEKHFLASVFGFLTGVTRLIGIFTFIPILIYLIINRKKIDVKNTFVILSPILGFLSYAYYLYLTTGDFLKFLHVQPQFGANRSAEIILLPQVIFRYFKIFITANIDFVYFVAVVEFVVFCFVFGLLLYQLSKLLKKQYKIKKPENYSWLIGLNIFSLINLVLPTLTGTFTSVPRYVLLSLSFFITLAFVDSKLIKYTVSIVFIIFHVIFLSYFYRNFFIG